MIRQLPPALRSLYRLVLRTSSASVLHARPAAPRLRARWRPTFDEAARMAQKVQQSTTTVEEVRAAAQAQEWLNTWEKQMDNTLSLLYNSAISYGLAHKLTRNLHTLSNHRKHWLHHIYERNRSQWSSTGKPVNFQQKRRLEGKPGELAWNMVGEVVRMAEGRDQLMLGRTPPPQYKTYRNVQ